MEKSLNAVSACSCTCGNDSIGPLIVASRWSKTADAVSRDPSSRVTERWTFTRPPRQRGPETSHGLAVRIALEVAMIEKTRK